MLLQVDVSNDPVNQPCQNNSSTFCKREKADHSLRKLLFYNSNHTQKQARHFYCFINGCDLQNCPKDNSNKKANDVKVAGAVLIISVNYTSQSKRQQRRPSYIAGEHFYAFVLLCLCQKGSNICFKNGVSLQATYQQHHHHNEHILDERERIPLFTNHALRTVV